MDSKVTYPWVVSVSLVFASRGDVESSSIPGTRLSLCNEITEEQVDTVVAFMRRFVDDIRKANRSSIVLVFFFPGILGTSVLKGEEGLVINNFIF